jgi:hypothetical protein
VLAGPAHPLKNETFLLRDQASVQAALVTRLDYSYQLGDLRTFFHCSASWP